MISFMAVSNARLKLWGLMFIQYVLSVKMDYNYLEI